MGKEGLESAGLLATPTKGVSCEEGGAVDLITPLPLGRDFGLHLWPCSPLHLGSGGPGCWTELHHDWHLRGTICDGGGVWGQGFKVNWHAIWGSVMGD